MQQVNEWPTSLDVVVIVWTTPRYDFASCGLFVGEDPGCPGAASNSQ